MSDGELLILVTALLTAGRLSCGPCSPDVRRTMIVECLADAEFIVSSVGGERAGRSTHD